MYSANTKIDVNERWKALVGLRDSYGMIVDSKFGRILPFFKPISINPGSEHIVCVNPIEHVIPLALHVIAEEPDHLLIKHFQIANLDQRYDEHGHWAVPGILENTAFPSSMVLRKRFDSLFVHNLAKLIVMNSGMNSQLFFAYLEVQ